MPSDRKALFSCGGFIGDAGYPCHTLYEAVAEGVLILDEQGRIVHCNERAARLLGKARKSLVGRLAVGLAAAGDREPLASLLSGKEARTEITLRASRRPVRALCSVGPIMFRGAPGSCLLATDLTSFEREEKLKMEAALLRHREEMQKEFLANFSHELRTPLAAIRGFAETLREGAVDDRKHRMEFLGSIERHAALLTALVEDILEVSALETSPRPLTMQVIDLRTFVGDVKKDLEPLLRRHGISLSVDIEPGLEVRANPDKLMRALQNLCQNAIKYNRKRGTITVRAKPHSSRFALVSVSDTGRGVPKADLTRIFDRFHRGKNSDGSKGIGLGLAITKAVVERHGGKIWAESVPGKGSTFFFTLPLPRK